MTSFSSHQAAIRISQQTAPMENGPQSISGALRRRQLCRRKAWVSIKSNVTRPRQVPAMLTVSTDALSVVKSAAKTTTDATTRSLDDPGSTT